MATEPYVLALDIGTRTIVGLVMAAEAGGYRIKAVQIEEHPYRSMFQGQIHDINAVAAVVKRVKEGLENRIKCKLKKAALAAAGRTLATAQGASRQTPRPTQMVTAAQVRALELEAVRRAQAELANAGSKQAKGYLCVGYSVLHYYLEGHPILNLVGQRGQEIGVEVIATFLPQVVIDSLLAVLETVGLEVHSLTLEPIAALNVTLSPGMRNLNLALVDIGAGTSDIAISRKGTIIAYDMVPRAGDEITESLCSTYLLDFPVGEKLKRKLGQREVKFTDIMGNGITLPSTQVKNTLKPIVADLAQAIATTILKLNQRAPDGLILIGGGSQTPFLPQMLAEALGLSPERVGIRRRESLEGIKGHPKRLAGPQAVTPIGIGVWAFRDHPFIYRRVFVNGNPIHLWNLEDTIVADALLATNTQWERLHPRPGLALTIEVNGQLKIIKGEMGEPAQILVNGKKAALDTALEEDDQLVFKPPRDGRNATATIGDILKDKRAKVQINGRSASIPPQVFMNGKEVKDLNTPIADRARLEIKYCRPLKYLLSAEGVAEKDLLEEKYSYTLNGKGKTSTRKRYVLLVNGHPASPETLVKEGDTITHRESVLTPTLGDILGAFEENMEIILNKKPFTFPREIEITMNGEKASLSTPLTPDADIRVSTPKQILLADLFAHYDPRAQGKGTHLILRVNGEPANFTSPIQSGDAVDIYWEDTRS
ncbi:MAG: hypothetical protein GX349_02375 [Firmicutes bacterium]|nr:hypothetical protein [Bacillota bacterium]